MARPGEGKGQAKATHLGKAWQLQGLTLLDVCAAVRRLSKDLAGLRRKKIQMPVKSHFAHMSKDLDTRAIFCGGPEP
jgi:hypothetical protein